MRLYLNAALKTLVMSAGVIIAASAMIGPIYGLMVEQIGGDLLDASLTFFIYSIVTSMTLFVSGKLFDKRRQGKNILVLGFLVISVGYFAYLLVDSVQKLYLVQVLIGIGTAIYSPAWDSMYSTHITKKHEGTQWATWEITNQFTAAIGALVGGIIASQWGFSPLFILMGGVCLLSALYVSQSRDLLS
jgi:MFS family permease